jgi:hypothetical protein
MLTDYVSGVPLRRLVGLLTAAFMLHLNVLAADSACAAHAGASATAGMSHHGSAAQGHGPHAASREAGDRVNEPCQAPSQPRCCEAMANCFTVGVGSQVCSAHHGIAQDSVIDRATGSLLTRFIAPETPPPKA